MSRISEALKRAQQEQNPEQTTASSRASRGEMLPEELVPLDTPLHGVLLDRCRRPKWNLQEGILSRGHSEDHVVAAEELRKLGAWLTQRQRADSLKTLLVTSASPREGKTFVAVNLAWTMAQAKNRRVLLVDGDLRSPSAHLMLGAPLTPGLAEYLEGGVEEAQILQQGPLSNFFFISGGKSTVNPVELLSTDALKKLISQLSPLFDWIVFDSTPVVSVADARLIAALTDKLLLVVAAGTSSREAVAKARDFFVNKGLLGVVLNYADPRESYSSYYYRAYKGRQP